MTVGIGRLSETIDRTRERHRRETSNPWPEELRHRQGHCPRGSAGLVIEVWPTLQG